MNASGRQTAPPLFEVVSVTSALWLSLEASPRVKDLFCAAAVGSSRSLSPAGVSSYPAPGYRSSPTQLPGTQILSGPTVSGT